MVDPFDEYAVQQPREFDGKGRTANVTDEMVDVLSKEQESADQKKEYCEKQPSEFGGKKLKDALLSFLRRKGYGRPEGVSLSELARFADPAPYHAVVNALAELDEEGELYAVDQDLDSFQYIEYNEYGLLSA